MAADAAGWVEEMLAEVAGEEAGRAFKPGEALIFSPLLGRQVRADATWPEAGIATYTKAQEAIEAGNWSTAAEYVDFFLDEAFAIFGFFRTFMPDAMGFFTEKGLSRIEIAEVNRRILSMLPLPDGRPFVARALWTEVQAEKRACLVACGKEDAASALEHLARCKELWRQVQDRDVDHVYGLLNEAAARWGEGAVGEMWDALIGPLFQSRYEKFDVRRNPWSESLWTNVYLAFEAMRGHLVGPARDGNMEFTETEERYTWRFDPCGSGGRSLRGDTIEGSPPRMEPPFNYGVFEEEHDYAWRKKGVCYYCVNCCLVMQLMPIDHFGYPVRVVEPPTYPDNREAKCTWHVYKDPRDVPERFYTDVGRVKPQSIPGLDGPAE